MKYLINDSVLFDTAEYQLSLSNDKASLIKLSNTAGRVLQELMAAHGEGNTVTREWLFDNVWIKHGLQPSNGNLNQQISLIRKALVSLGLDATAIVTLPKRGLKLNDRLIITLYGHSPPQPMTGLRFIDDIPDGQPDNPVPAIPWANKQILVNGILGISIIATLLMAYVYFSNNDKQPLFFLDQMDACNIYTFRPINAREKEPVMAQLRSAMNGNIEKCSEQHFILFAYNNVTNTRVRNGINRRVFMAKCERDARGNIVNCLNFYFYNWDE